MKKILFVLSILIFSFGCWNYDIQKRFTDIYYTTQIEIGMPKEGVVDILGLPNYSEVKTLEDGSILYIDCYYVRDEVYRFTEGGNVAVFLPKGALTSKRLNSQVKIYGDEKSLYIYYAEEKKIDKILGKHRKVVIKTEIE